MLSLSERVISLKSARYILFSCSSELVSSKQFNIGSSKTGDEELIDLIFFTEFVLGLAISLRCEIGRLDSFKRLFFFERSHLFFSIFMINFKLRISYIKLSLNVILIIFGWSISSLVTKSLRSALLNLLMV